MTDTALFRIQWADYLVDHFTSFFPAQWDSGISASLASRHLPDYARCYATAALQEVLDCVTSAAKQSEITGFSPTLNYAKVLPAPPGPDRHAPAVLEAILEALRSIEKTDRRGPARPGRPQSLGDYFFVGIRQILDTNIPVDSVDDHAATARYFGENGYYAMLASGVSPDLLLLNYAGQGHKYPTSTAALAQFVGVSARTSSLQLRNLFIATQEDAPPLSIEELMFKDCDFGPKAIDSASNSFFDHCLFKDDSFRVCENVSFEHCVMQRNLPDPQDVTVRPPDTDHPPPPKTDGPEFLDCSFGGAFFDNIETRVGFRDCYFSHGQLANLDIRTLAGDYSEVTIDGCRIHDFAPGTRIGPITRSIIDDATEVGFIGDLRDVRFRGTIDSCSFGTTDPTLLDHVTFGSTHTATAVQPIDQPRSSIDQADTCVVSNTRFEKGLSFHDVRFDCILQDPDFVGSLTGITNIWDLRASHRLKRTFRSINFGSIQSGPKGGIDCLIGGSVGNLNANIKHISHTLIRTIGQSARIGTYEAILDSSMRRQWKIRSGPILIGSIRGRIDKFVSAGEGNSNFSIGTVLGKIHDFQPCATIHRLGKGGVVTFAEQTNVDQALTNQCITEFKGGEFGVWEGQGDTRLVRYFRKQEDYWQRDLRGEVVNIFGGLE